MKKSKLAPDPENINLVTINDWGLPKSEEIMSQIREAVRLAASEAIAYSLAEHVSFNFDLDRPLMGRVSLPLTDFDTCDGPAWEIDLKRELLLVLEYYSDNRAQLVEMRDELVGLVESFNEVLNLKE